MSFFSGCLCAVVGDARGEPIRATPSGAAPAEGAGADAVEKVEKSPQASSLPAADDVDEGFEKKSIAAPPEAAGVEEDGEGEG